MAIAEDEAFPRALRIAVMLEMPVKSQAMFRQPQGSWLSRNPQ